MHLFSLGQTFTFNSCTRARSDDFFEHRGKYSVLKRADGVNNSQKTLTDRTKATTGQSHWKHKENVAWAYFMKHWETFHPPGWKVKVYKYTLLEPASGGR